MLSNRTVGHWHPKGDGGGRGVPARCVAFHLTVGQWHPKGDWSGVRGGGGWWCPAGVLPSTSPLVGGTQRVNGVGGGGGAQ